MCRDALTLAENFSMYFNQMWFLCMDICADKATFELHTLQEE